MKVKEESEKGGSTLNIQKTKIMATGPITSRQIKRDRFYSGGGSKITVDDDCYHEIKRLLLLGRKVMTNLDSIFKKQRQCFADKSLSSQNYGFPSNHI